MLGGPLRQHPTALRPLWQASFAARIFDGLGFNLLWCGSPSCKRAALTSSAWCGCSAWTRLGPTGRVIDPPASPELTRTFNLLKHWGMADVDIKRLARKVKPDHLDEPGVSRKLQWLATELHFTRPEVLDLWGPSLPS